MVAFRKMSPMLALAGLLLGSSALEAQVVNQAPLQCIANAGVPPVVRAEGLTELVGDIVLTCTGGNPNAPFLANFQVALNTNITSRILSGSLTEGLLLIDEPAGTSNPAAPCLSPNADANRTGVLDTGGFSGGAAPCNVGTNVPGGIQRGTYNAFRGQIQTTGANLRNALLWTGIPVIPPGTAAGTSRIFRFTNIRANASIIGAPTTLIPNQIFAFVSVSPSNTLAIDNPQQTVAFPQRGLAFSATPCGNSPFSQCVGQSLAGASTLNFTEGFPTAFKTRIDVAQENSVPGVVYNTESGFVRSSWNTADGNAVNIGRADFGTRLAARFRDLPADATIFVSVANARANTAAPTARLIATSGIGDTTGIGFVTPTSSAGFCVGVPGLGTNSEGGFNGTGSNAVALTVSGGTATAIWEIVAANSFAIDNVQFGVAISYTPNLGSTPATPGIGTSRVTGSFAPFYAGANDVNNAAGQWSSSLPIPRFLDTGDPVNAFAIISCQTNLLFPFVTAQAGFDTGIAISNTSRDAFDSPAARAQGGTCIVNYFGNVTGATTGPSPATSAVIPPGGQLAFVLSSGNTQIAGTPNFQGYLHVRCNFQYAHGFAFITDGPVGQARIAEGYLALILDQGSPLVRSPISSESLDH